MGAGNQWRQGPASWAALACWVLTNSAEVLPLKSALNCNSLEPSPSELLVRARAFYRHGTFDSADFEWVSRVVQLRAALRDSCPAVVLQALLLKLEENIVYEPRAFEAVLREYTLLLQASILRGSLSQRDLAAWPLQEGLERVLAISQALETPRTLSTAMVMNYCQPRDRFGALHELQWLLEPPFGELRDPADRRDSGLLSDTDLYIYVVDAPKCGVPSEDLVAQLRRVVRTVHVEVYRAGPEREEQTAYFKFIADHYDDLPDFTIFTHPDAPEHQGAEFLALRRALVLLRTQSAFAYDSIGYYPIAQQMVVDPRRTWGVEFAPIWRRFWQRLLGRPWSALGYWAPRCKWEAHTGAYIAGVPPEAPDRRSLPGAKAACIDFEGCVGVTCLTPLTEEEVDVDGSPTSLVWLGLAKLGQLSCTIRVGDPPGLHESPAWQETSYLMSCAEEGSSAHENAEVPGAPEGSAAATYVRYQNVFLPDYAKGDSDTYDAKGARYRCDELGSLCSGFTCDAGEQECTVRAQPQMYESPTGEISYRKWADVLPEVVRNSLESTISHGASAVFQMYTGSQSIVRKDRLLVWPYEDLVAFGADGPFCSNYSGLLEAVWHWMFGEPLSQWPRERDPMLPLFLKWGVPTFYSHGDEGVI